MKTLRLRPRRPLIIRPHQHRTLIIVGELLRIRELDLARSTTQSHERFPDAQGGGLLGGLRGERPGVTTVEGSTDGDAEVRGAGGPDVVIAECGQDSARGDFEEEHIVDVAVAARDFAMVDEGVAVVGADGDEQGAFPAAVEARERSKDAAIAESREPWVGAGGMVGEETLVVVEDAVAAEAVVARWGVALALAVTVTVTMVVV